MSLATPIIQLLEPYSREVKEEVFKALQKELTQNSELSKLSKKKVKPKVTFKF